MDEDTRKEVERAWEKCPECRPKSVLGAMEWHPKIAAWIWRPTPYSDELSYVFHPDQMIHAALHTAILERGWHLRQRSPDRGPPLFQVCNGWVHDELAPQTRSSSAISAMARAIVAGKGETQ